jgi:phage shock protein C
MAVKKLRRSKKERIIAGVCGGLAEYFGVDVTLVRIAFVLAFILFGIGIIPYAVLWLVMPPKPK